MVKSVMIKSAMIKSAMYLCGSTLLFLRPYPATGSNFVSGSLVAFFSGPMYQFVAAHQHYTDRVKYGEISAHGVDGTTVVLIAIWIFGIWALVVVDNRLWLIIIFSMVWCMVGILNLFLFGLSGI